LTKKKKTDILLWTVTTDPKFDSLCHWGFKTSSKNSIFSTQFLSNQQFL